MGLIIKEKPGQSSSGATATPATSAAAGSTIAVLSAGENDIPSNAPPTAATNQPLGSIDISTLTEREMPHLASARENKFQVAIKRSVLADIRDHGKGEPDIEVCGVLVGNVYRDQSGPFLHIEANIRGNNATGKAAQVTFTADTWKHIQDVMEDEYPDDRIVGWYHTHPGFGIFLSDMDLFIHNNFFSEPWQVAFVYDPKSNEQGLFLRRGGTTLREKFLLDGEGEPISKADAAMMATSAQMIAPGTIAELSGRVQRLERKQRWNAATFWLMLLLVIAWPLAMSVYLPNGVRDLPPSVQQFLGTDRFAKPLTVPVPANTPPGANASSANGPTVTPALPAPPSDPERATVARLAMLRGQILVYKREHGGKLPALANFWKQLTQYTSATGETSATKDATHLFGPYYETPSKNVLTDSDVVGKYEGDANTGWAYDENSGQIQAMKSAKAGDLLVD